MRTEGSEASYRFMVLVVGKEDSRSWQTPFAASLSVARAPGNRNVFRGEFVKSKFFAHSNIKHRHIVALLASQLRPIKPCPGGQRMRSCDRVLIANVCRAKKFARCFSKDFVFQRFIPCMMYVIYMY